MELALVVGTVGRRYDFELRTGQSVAREGVSWKPVGCRVSVRKRGKGGEGGELIGVLLWGRSEFLKVILREDDTVNDL